MDENDGGMRKEPLLTGAWWKFRERVIPTRIGKYRARVRVQIILMFSITLGFVLLSLYVFHSV